MPADTLFSATINADQTRSDSSRSDPLKKPQTILVVGDFRTTRLIAREHLFRKGFKVLEASGGREALLMLQKYPVNGILADWEMPEPDGLTLLMQIRQHPDYQSLLFMMLSPDSSQQKISQAIHAGTDDVLIKPFTPAVLCEKVIRMMKKQQHHPDQATPAIQALQWPCPLLTQAETDTLNQLINRLKTASEVQDQSSSPEQSADLQHLSELTEKLLQENQRLRSELSMISQQDYRSLIRQLIEQCDELNQSRSLNAEQRQQSEGIRNHIYQLMDRLNTTLYLWQLESNQVELDQENADLAQIMHQLLQRYRPLARQQEITLAYEGRDSLTARVDSLITRTLLDLLFQFALDKCPRREDLVIKTPVYTDEACISLYLPALLTDQEIHSFSQKHPEDSLNNRDPRQRNIQWTIALLARVQGGRIEADCQPGLGSIINLFLPEQTGCADSDLARI